MQSQQQKLDQHYDQVDWGPAQPGVVRPDGHEAQVLCEGRQRERIIRGSILKITQDTRDNRRIMPDRTV
jgi:hypothetical protein